MGHPPQRPLHELQLVPEVGGHEGSSAEGTTRSSAPDELVQVTTTKADAALLLLVGDASPRLVIRHQSTKRRSAP
jgi:hypothetical protein